MKRSVVIAGTGQAGFQVAASLRQDGFDGEILMIGDEPGLPYQRPPLSKAYLKEGGAERLLLRNADFYEKNAVALADGRRIARIDRAGRRVELADGTSFGYTDLVLAVGARNRRLPLPGIDLAGVLELRTLAHADTIRTALLAASDVVVIGGGFIGLEVAATAVAAGARVTVLEATERPMSRVVSPAVSAFFEAAHRAAGVRLLTSAAAARILDGGDGRVSGVELAEGSRIAADTVLVAAGVVPNVELASDAGLAVENGIVVDAAMRTDDPAISAIGDCAAFVFAPLGRRTRLESVQNAVDQAKTVSRRIVGAEEPYDRVPWFWSDQGSDKLQIAGLTTGADDHVVREDADRRRLTVFAFRGGLLAGVETVNAPADHMVARRLLARPTPFTRTEAEAAGFDMAALRAAAGG